MPLALRSILVVTLFSAAMIWLVGDPHQDLMGSTETPRVAMKWVRTSDGWQRPANWYQEEPSRQPQLHPFTVAAMQVLGSVFGLLAFSTTSRDRN